MEAIAESELKKSYPSAFEYFFHFKKDLLERSLYKRWGKGKPFYSMFDIGTYTFQPYRVAWKRTTRKFAAAVMGYIEDEWLGKVLLMPNGKVMIIPCENEKTAYFVCGLLNSSPARSRINSSISSEAHAEIINLVHLPKFDSDNPLHVEISALVKRCHETAARSRHDEIGRLELEIDEKVATLWKIKKGDLKQMQDFLEERGKERGDLESDE